LAQAERTGNAAGFLAFAREYRQTLESYFDITERMAERGGTGGTGEVAVHVVYENEQKKNGAERNIVCSRCHQIIDWEDHQRRYVEAVRHALGFDASGPAAPRANPDPELPAGVDPDELQ